LAGAVLAWIDVEPASALATKACPSCGARVPGDALFCPNDGTPLRPSTAGDTQATPDPYLGMEIAGHIQIKQLVGIGAMGRVYRASSATSR
jgi:serine/threonine-protein kinase